MNFVNAAYIRFRHPTGSVKRGISSFGLPVNAREATTLPRKKLEHENDSVIGVGGQGVLQNCNTQFTVRRGDQFITLPTRKPNDETILDKAIALVGCPHINLLGTSLDYLMAMKYTLGAYLQ